MTDRHADDGCPGDDAHPRDGDRTAPIDRGERIDVDAHIDADPAEVFEYLVDPERRPFGRDDFLTLGVEIAREPAGTEGARVAWEVTVSDGVERLPGTVEVLVRPEGTGSRLLVRHRITSSVETLRAVEAPSAVRRLALAA